MLKKLLIPFVVFTAAAVVGCGSSSSSTGAGGSRWPRNGRHRRLDGWLGRLGGWLWRLGGGHGRLDGRLRRLGGWLRRLDGGRHRRRRGWRDGWHRWRRHGWHRWRRHGRHRRRRRGRADPGLAGSGVPGEGHGRERRRRSFTAEEFCEVYMDVCGTTTFTGMLTAADCATTYASWSTKKVMGMATVGEQNCTSYHVCNAYNERDRRPG